MKKPLLLLALGLASCTSPNPAGNDDSGTGENCTPGAEECECTPSLACDDGLTCTEDGLCEPSPAVCGDGIIEGSEACDDGPQNGPNGSCFEDCTQNVCGDGIPGPDEACDDGNDVNEDDCTTECTVPACGDGYVQGAEECDDGNDVNEDGCVQDCVVAACGDGFVWAGLEDCEDGNDEDRDACSNSCFFTEFPSCGNGEDDPGELCFSAGTPIQLPGDTGVTRFFLADLNGDGLADILFDDFDGNESRSYRIAAQDGGFGAAFPLPDSTAPAISIWEVYDIDGDGAPDMLNAASDGQFYTRFGDPDQANYFANSENIKGPFTIGAVGSMVFGHFDGDERIDVAWTSGVDIGVVLQPVHRTFADAETVAQMNFGLALASMDTDGDGLSTAVGFGSFPSSMFGYAGSPLELTFEEPSYPADTTLTLKALGIALDGDAGEELVTISFDDQNTCEDFDQDACARPLVLVHGGSGGEVDTQGPYPLPSPGLVPSQIQSADMDGDGDADLVLLDLNADAVHIYRNLGDGTFSSPVIIGFDVTTIGDRLQLGDINGDEKADIAIASNDANIRFLLSTN